MNDESFTIRLRTPGESVKQISVNPFDPVSSVCSHGVSLIMFGNQLLCPIFTFQFYGIKPNDLLEVVTINGDVLRHMSVKRTVKRETLAPEDAERVKLRDRVMTRIEASKRGFRRFLKRFEEIVDERTERETTYPWNLTPANQPSEEALPIMWSQPL